eukprot:156610_1
MALRLLFIIVSIVVVLSSDCYSCGSENSPVCCAGNIQYRNQCHADCSSATNCISQTCNNQCNLIDIACEIGRSCQAVAGGNVGEVGCEISMYYCAMDSDCEVKNVGNCCGYYPKCVNTNYEPDAASLAASCVGMSSVCGWPVINTCSCVNNQCVANSNTITQVPDTTTTGTTAIETTATGTITTEDGMATTTNMYGTRNGGYVFHSAFGAMIAFLLCYFMHIYR